MGDGIMIDGSAQNMVTASIYNNIISNCGVSSNTLSSWDRYTSDTYTYQTNLKTQPAAVWENFNPLVLKTSIAEVEANAGSYFWVSNVLYVHASDGSNPGTNGKNYAAKNLNNSLGWCQSAGIFLDQPQKNTSSVYNNTIFGCGIGIYYYGNAQNYIVKNNLIMNSIQYQQRMDWNNSNIIIDYNCIYPLVGNCFYWNHGAITWSYWNSIVGYDANSKTSDPIFVNVSGSYIAATDFQLQAGSPCINAGTNVGLTQDHFGNPIQGAPDIGAVEYIPQTSSPDLGFSGVASQVIDDGRIVYQASDGHENEIYCYVPGQGVIQLTNNTSDDAMPQMNPSGHLVWENWDGKYWQVWYNVGNGPVKLTSTNNGSNLSPQITNKDQIYWQGWDGHDYEIYSYNPGTKIKTQLTNNTQDDCAPKVNSSGQLTWMFYDGHDWEIRYNIGKGVVQRTINSYDDVMPQITDDGTIYWQGWDGHDWEIYSYTFGKSAAKQLTNNTVDDMAPAVDNGILVWSQWDGHYWQIYQEVLKTGIVTQITNDSYDNKNPQVNASDQIVWQLWDGNDYRIYEYQ